MTRIALHRKAILLFRSPYAPRALQRANARKWILAVDRLGDRWLLAPKAALPDNVTAIRGRVS